MGFMKSSSKVFFCSLGLVLGSCVHRDGSTPTTTNHPKNGRVVKDVLVVPSVRTPLAPMKSRRGRDSDGDGILDPLDACIGLKGVLEWGGCPEDTGIRLTQDALLVLETIEFEIDSGVIRAQSFETLETIAAVLMEHPEVEFVQVEGHLDGNVPTYPRASYLSETRAKSVRKFLLSRGVRPDRIQAVGFEEHKPIATNETAKGRAKNRRIDFVILKRTAHSKETIRKVEGTAKKSVK